MNHIANARHAHNPKVGGSNPPPATNLPAACEDSGRAEAFSLDWPVNTAVLHVSDQRPFREGIQNGLHADPDMILFAGLAAVANFPDHEHIPELNANGCGLELRQDGVDSQTTAGYVQQPDRAAQGAARVQPPGDQNA